MQQVQYKRQFTTPNSHANFLMKEGLTLAQMITELEIPAELENYLTIYIDNKIVLREYYKYIKPREHTKVKMVLLPQGGGDDIFRMVAMIGLSLLAPQVALGLGFVAGSAGYIGITLLVTISGALLLNAIFPPPEAPELADLNNSPALTIQGTKNSAKYDKPVQRIYGTVKTYPPYAAQPYTISLGGVQYMYLLYDLGYGDLDVTDLMIGDSPLSNFNEVDFNIINVQTKNDLTYFTNDIETETINVTMKDFEPAIVRTSSNEQKYIQFDLVFAAGLYRVNAETGDTLSTKVEFIYELTDDTGTVIQPADYTLTLLTHTFNGVFVDTDTSDSFTVRAAVDDGFSITAQIDVGIVTDTVTLSLSRGSSSKSTSAINNASYAALRTFKKGNAINPFRFVDLTGINPVRLSHTMVEMRIQATDQLNGVVDSFNCIATSKLRTYDGANITAPVATNNPAWVFADILTGTLNQRPKADSKLNWDQLKAWADFCDELAAGEFGNFTKAHTCNFVLDYSGTVFSLMKEVCAIGRASPDIYDDTYSVIFENVKTLKTQLFTNANSRNFGSNRTYTEFPDAIKVSFRDPDSDWQMRDVVVYNDGFDETNAKLFETIESPMTTNSEEAYRNGRYWLKQAALRKETITFDTDIDWLECKRGDLIGFQHDVMKVGGTTMRVTAVSGTVVTVDTDPQMNGNTVDFFELRPATSFVVSGFVAFYNVNDKFTIDLGTSGATVGDLLIINSTGSTSYDLIIKAIDVNPDQSAKITCVEYAPALLTLASAPVPVYTPQIGTINRLNSAPKILFDLTASETLSIINKQTYVTITLNYQPEFGTIPANYRVFKQAADASWILVGSTTNTSFVWIEQELAINNPLIGVQHNFAVVAVSDDGNYVDPANARQVSIIPQGDITPPTEPDYFVVEDTAENLRRFWWGYDQTTTPNDLDGYVIRYTRSGLQDWSSASSLHDGILLEPPFELRALPQGAQTIMIKSVDTSGNFSALTKEISFNLGERATENVLFTKEFSDGSPSWVGFTAEGNPIIDGSNRLSADTTTSGKMWNTVNLTPMWGENSTLMWIAANDTYQWAANVTLPSAGITTLNWVGDGEIILKYAQGTWPGSVYNVYDSFFAPATPMNLYYNELNNDAWQDNSWFAVVTPNTTADINGDVLADTLTDGSTSSALKIKQEAGITAGTTYTASVYILKDTDETRFPLLKLSYVKGGTLTTGEISLNTKTGAVISAGTFDTATVISAGNYWQLYITITSVTANTVAKIELYPAYAATIGGGVSTALTGSIVAWGCAVVQGTTAYNGAGLALTSNTKDLENGSWFNLYDNGNVLANTTNDPIDNLTADTVTRDTIENFELTANVTIAYLTQYTLSIYIKKDTDETRFPQMSGMGANNKMQLNTKTGAVWVDAGNSFDATGVNDRGEYWQMWATETTTGSGSTDYPMTFNPAFSSSLGGVFDSAASGAVIASGFVLIQSSAAWDGTGSAISYKYTGAGQGIIPYTSPINLPAGDYFVIVDSAKSVDVNRLSKLTWTTDVPDINEYFTDKVVTASGDTVINLNKTFAAITNVSITLQSDGNNADSVRIISKTTTAITIRCYSGTTTQVAGLIDMRVQGY